MTDNTKAERAKRRMLERLRARMRDNPETVARARTIMINYAGARAFARGIKCHEVTFSDSMTDDDRQAFWTGYNMAAMNEAARSFDEDAQVH